MSFALIFVVIYIAGCVYLRWQLIWWLKKTDFGAAHSLHMLAVTLGVIDCVPIAGAFVPESIFGAYLQMIGNVWVALTLSTAICLIIVHIAKIFIKEYTAGIARSVIALILVFVCLFCMYGFVHAQRIKTHYYKVDLTADGAELVDQQMSDPGKAADDTRLVLLADMHMGVNTRYSTVEKMVEMVNDADPDYIIGAGDYFTSSYVGLLKAEKYADLLAKMTKETDTEAYFAYGNHDVTEPLFCGFAIKKPSQVYRYEDMDRFFERCNWKMLNDECVTLAGIQFAFRQDESKAGDGINKRLAATELVKGLDQTRPIIAIEHEPEDYENLAKAGVDLSLSGHTHDGQIWPGNWVTRAISNNAHGFRVVDGVPTIVSSGVGYFGPPMRIGTHGEIVIIDIVH